MPVYTFFMLSQLFFRDPQCLKKQLKFVFKPYIKCRETDGAEDGLIIETAKEPYLRNDFPLSYGERHEPSFFIEDEDDLNSDDTSLDKGVQTEPLLPTIRIEMDEGCDQHKTKVRDIDSLLELLNGSEDKRDQLTSLEVKSLVDSGHISAHKLESILGDNERGIEVRRMLVEEQARRPGVLSGVPFAPFDYSLVMGACCENVIGYVPIPLGVAGPLLLNGKHYYVPMATTEGCLVASINRGCRALILAGGAKSTVYADGMTRGPVIHFSSAMRAVEALKWLKNDENYEKVKQAFDSTSRFARLQRIDSYIAGRYLYLRFVGLTGDAMGMNMLSKGTESALRVINEHFNDIEALCLSGNVCADKKSAAINWTEGRGKSVLCEAVIPGKVVADVLKTTPIALENFTISKNLVGSAIAGTCGGNNVHAANTVAAIFIACGQVGAYK